MAKGNAAKLQALRDSLKVVTTINPPSGGGAQLYLALFVTNPGNDGSGTEVSYAGYARQPINFDGDPVLNGSVAEILNTNAIEFATVPTSSGNCAYAAIMPTSVIGEGVPIYYGALAASYTLSIGVKPTVPIGGLIAYEN